MLRLHFLLYFKKRARKQGVEGGKKHHLPKLGERLQEMSYLDWPINHEKKEFPAGNNYRLVLNF